MKLFSFSELNPTHVIYLKEPPRPVLVQELVQFHTYRNLIMGVPAEKHNEALPGRLIEEAQARFGNIPQPVLIPTALQSYSVEQQQYFRPPRGEFAPTGETITRIGQRYPLVTCIASLRCPLPLVELEKGGEFAYSCATLIWFQEKLALPIDPVVLARIQALDWAAIAVDTSD